MTIFYRLQRHGQPIDEGKAATTLTVGAGSAAQVRLAELDADDVVLEISEVGTGELHVRASGWCDGLRVGGRAMRPDGEYVNPADVTLATTLGDYRLEVREGSRDPLWGDPSSGTVSHSPLLTSDVSISALPTRRKGVTSADAASEKQAEDDSHSVAVSSDLDIKSLGGGRFGTKSDAIPEGNPLLDGDDDDSGTHADPVPSFDDVRNDEAAASKGVRSDIELSVFPSPKASRGKDKGAKTTRPSERPIPPPVPMDSEADAVIPPPPPPSPSSLTIRERDEDGHDKPISVLELIGSLDASTTDDFMRAMEGLVRRRRTWIVLDFGGVDFVNSSGLGTLVRLAEQFERDGAIVLVNVPGKVRSTFELLGLESLMTIHSRMNQALGDIQRRQRQRQSAREQERARAEQAKEAAPPRDEPVDATKISLEDSRLEDLALEEETIDAGADPEAGEEDFDAEEDMRPTSRARRVAPQPPASRSAPPDPSPLADMAPPSMDDEFADEMDAEEPEDEEPEDEEPEDEIGLADEDEDDDDDYGARGGLGGVGESDLMRIASVGSASPSGAGGGGGRASAGPPQAPFDQAEIAADDFAAQVPPPPAPAAPAAEPAQEKLEAPAEPEPEAFGYGSAAPPPAPPGGPGAIPVAAGMPADTSSLPVPELKRKKQAAAAPARSQAPAPKGSAVAEEKPQPQPQLRPKPMPAGTTLERKTTVRYYSRVNPDRNFPLLVLLTRPEIKVDKPRQARVVQKEGKSPFSIKEGNPIVTVIPRFPGCLVVPDKLHVDVTPDHVELPFWVTPQAVGELRDARVEVWYEGQCIDVIKCPTRCRRQTTARAAAAVGVLAPVFFSTFEATTGTTVQEQTRSMMQVNVPYIAEQVGGFTNLGIYAGAALIAGALVAWLLARPKRSASPAESFFDFTLQQQKSSSKE